VAVAVALVVVLPAEVLAAADSVADLAVADSRAVVRAEAGKVSYSIQSQKTDIQKHGLVK
jgi:hypothetical protein